MSANNDRGVMRDGGKTTAPRFVYTAEERELLRNLVIRHRHVIRAYPTCKGRCCLYRIACCATIYGRSPLQVVLHTLTQVPAEGSNVLRTAPTAAPQENGDALAPPAMRSARSRSHAPLPSRSARSRIAAVERVLAPEAAVRIEALKNYEWRKGELHAMELRLRRQQLSQQRQLQRMRMQQEQELHKI
ncbi:hypothetical protein MTO96_045260 [Rhipicephalus appendiculatus]